VDGDRFAGLGGDAAEGPQFFQRGIHAGIVAQPETQPAGAFRQGLARAFQTALKVLRAHVTSIPAAVRVAHGGMADELSDVDQRALVRHVG
jgi:hypothetical protein